MTHDNHRQICCSLRQQTLCYKNLQNVVRTYLSELCTLRLRCSAIYLYKYVKLNRYFGRFCKAVSFVERLWNHRVFQNIFWKYFHCIFCLFVLCGVIFEIWEIPYRGSYRFTNATQKSEAYVFPARPLVLTTYTSSPGSANCNWKTLKYRVGKPKIRFVYGKWTNPRPFYDSVQYCVLLKININVRVNQFDRYQVIVHTNWVVCYSVGLSIKR